MSDMKERVLLLALMLMLICSGCGPAGKPAIAVGSEQSPTASTPSTSAAPSQGTASHPGVSTPSASTDPSQTTPPSQPSSPARSTGPSEMTPSSQPPKPEESEPKEPKPPKPDEGSDAKPPRPEGPLPPKEPPPDDPSKPPKPPPGEPGSVGKPGTQLPVMSERIVASFTQGLGYFYYNSPTLVDGYVYIGTSSKLKGPPARDNCFWKLDADLKKVWEYPLYTTEVLGGATLDSEGSVYFVAQEGKAENWEDFSSLRQYLVSLTNDGQLRWKNDITREADLDGGMYNPAVSADGTVYVSCGRIYAFGRDGSKKWVYPTEQPTDLKALSSPVIDGKGNVYVISGRYLKTPNVFCFAPDSQGAPKWVIDLRMGGECLSTPAFSTDQSRIYVACGKTIIRLRTENGSQEWAYTPDGAEGSFRGSPAVDAKNNVYVGTKANEKSVFYAVKADGTGLLWKNAIGADLYSSPALGDDSTIYVGSEMTAKGRFHALDMVTGEWKWGVDFPQKADVTWPSPVIYNGHVYIATMSDIERGEGGRVFKMKVDAKGYLPDAGWPRYHGGSGNTGRREP